MIAVIEGNITFTFPEDWDVCKYDETSFYRNQFQSVAEGCKGVDIAALDPFNNLHLIEVKDYRRQYRTKPINLATELAEKVRDTMAGLVAQRVNANDQQERAQADRLLRCVSIKVVAHVEVPAHPSRLWRNPINLHTLQIDLRTQLKAIDPHPRAEDRRCMENRPWTVA